MNPHYDIFISYNGKKDREDARALNQLLVDHLHLSTWFDDDRLLGGDEYAAEMERALTQSRACFVLFGQGGLGPWQKREVRQALRMNVDRPHFRVVPILLPSCGNDPNLPEQLRQATQIDLRRHPLRELRRLLMSAPGTQAPLYPGATSHARLAHEDPHELIDLDSLPSGYAADVTKVVELLIGESLYSRKDVCVRELMQNAVDACLRRHAGSVGDKYAPRITLNIDTREGWFEVDDNGEGMSSELLRNAFAVIGKSIRDESGVLQQVAGDKDALIAKFGIGFVSAFMVCSKVVVSTRFDGEEAISFSITGFNEHFAYTDESECGRDLRRIGTTIRIYLNDEYRRQLDVAAIARRYLRHVPGCRVRRNGKKLKLKDDWNVRGARYRTSVAGRAKRFELRLGASAEDGPFFASNWGFLITDDVRNVLPYFTPSWVIGEINFKYGSVDLNLSRDGIMDGRKAQGVKREMHRHLGQFLEVVAAKTQKAGNGKHGKKKRRLQAQLQRNVLDTVLLYDYFWRQRDKRPSRMRRVTSEDPLLTLPQTRGLILSMLRFPYGDSKTSMSLGEILDEMRRRNLETVYFTTAASLTEFTSAIAAALASSGHLVFLTEQRRAAFRGSRSGPLKASLRNILRPILKEHGFRLSNLSKVDPEEHWGGPTTELLPPEIRRLFETLVDGSADGGELIPVRLAGAPLVLSKGSRKFLNVEHPGLADFCRWAETAGEDEVLAFGAGLLSVTPQTEDATPATTS